MYLIRRKRTARRTELWLCLEIVLNLSQWSNNRSRDCLRVSEQVFKGIPAHE